MKFPAKIITLAALFAALLVGTAQADPMIYGSISFGGSAELDTIDLAAATTVTPDIVRVSSGQLDFSGLDDTLVTYNAFTFVPATGVSPLWTFTHNSLTYSFALETLMVVEQNAELLDLTGTGTLSITGYTPTAGDWAFTINNAGGSEHANFRFGFTASNAAVPDGGTTALLLGLAFVGMALTRRSFRKA